MYNVKQQNGRHKIPNSWNSLKTNRKIVGRSHVNTSSTQIHDRPISWLCTGTSIKSGGVTLALGARPLFLMK